MSSLARKGDPRAQKEYAAWLRKLDKAKKAYQEAYGNEEVEQLAAYGYEVCCAGELWRGLGGGAALAVGDFCCVCVGGGGSP
jgi:hypothetical protein